MLLYALLAASLTNIASPEPVEFDPPAHISGRTDKAPLSYEPGEEMTFTLKLADLGRSIPAGSRIFWKRTGDDGQTVTGSVAATSNPVAVTTSLDRPGFVRLRAELTDADGKPYPRRSGERWNASLGVYFDGGAAVRPYEIVEYPEPKGFDAFWSARKARLAALPLEVAAKEVPEASNTISRVFAVSVNCIGKRPLTAYVIIPHKAYAEGRKYPVSIGFEGYNPGLGHPKPPRVHEAMGERIYVGVNAHGYELGREKEYYQAFRKMIESRGCSYGFDKVQNSDVDQTYFSDWSYRVMRAVQYAKSLSQWNGKDLYAVGGSQGGFQAVWAATLGEGVTVLRVSVPWCCDFGRTQMGRNNGPWYVEWTPVLSYFDPVYLIKRLPVNCKFEIERAGLGDYICPPSGIALLYRNAAVKKKSVRWVQGSTHVYVPPPPRQEQNDKVCLGD